ncbi:hypothetical protein ACQP04_14460 [Pseudonocardia halophobica]|uniref:hypothetical protein n=1 Tax=Pseudonocardia halophobica TaxID=29401 RepID=UPI003D8AF3AB
MNPRAQFRDPLTLEQYHASRWITEPFHLLDCCLVSNGGIAVVVTSAERAAGLARPPVHVHGWGQAHPGVRQRRCARPPLHARPVPARPREGLMVGKVARDAATAEFFDAPPAASCSCAAAGTVTCPRRTRRPARPAAADLTPTPAEGGGTVVSHTAAHRRDGTTVPLVAATSRMVTRPRRPPAG